jgi:hypothetical protein
MRWFVADADRQTCALPGMLHGYDILAPITMGVSKDRLEGLAINTRLSPHRSYGTYIYVFL